jgi:hypothetical protein
MTFHISQALLIERTIVLSVTIALFGLTAIGGLLLLRRITGRTPVADLENQRTKAAHR